MKQDTVGIVEMHGVCTEGGHQVGGIARNEYVSRYQLRGGLKPKRYDSGIDAR